MFDYIESTLIFMMNVECSDSHIYILCTLFLYQYYLCLKFVCAFYVLFCGLTLLSRVKLLYGINFNLGAGCCI